MTRQRFFWLTVMVAISLLSFSSSTPAADVPKKTDTPTDPLAPILGPHLNNTVEVVLKKMRGQQKYSDDNFPMESKRFDAFRQEIVERFTKSVQLEKWVVRKPRGKVSPIAHLFEDRVLKTIPYQGVTLEVHAVTFPDSGLVVPMVVCLPPTKGKRPGICVYSGHSQHGLNDLVVNLKSYQSGTAVRLAQAGFVTIAVEKIDTGYLSRDGIKGVDESPLTTILLHWGDTIRSHQLKACLAAAEILAVHPRVDENQIGATGVSLGGWLSIQTALLSDRITAVADFGRKTLAISPQTTAKTFAGQGDLCHILPGMLSLCNRNVLALAYAPRPLLAGHGRKDSGSHREGPIHYKRLFINQYSKLGQANRYAYHIHEGGDTLPADAVIAWFKQQFNETK